MNHRHCHRIALIGLPGTGVPGLARELSATLGLALIQPDPLTGSIELPGRQMDPVNDFLISGFPLHVQQAQALDQLLNVLGRPLERIIVLQMPLAGLIERIRGRRQCRNCGEHIDLVIEGLADDISCPGCGGMLVTTRQHDFISEEDDLHAAARHFRRLVRYYRSQNRLSFVDATGNRRDDFRRVMQVMGRQA